MTETMPDTGIEAFVPFSTVHWWTLGIIFATCLIFPKLARGRAEMPLRRLVAAALLIHVAFKTWLWIVIMERPWNEMLPLHLCDVADVMAAILLIRGGQFLYELVYFWGLSGTLQALLTPDIPWSFPHPTYIAFFFGHGLIIVVAVYATWGMGLRPQPMSILRAFVCLNLYALFVTVPNILFDANYLYLMAKPESASLIDHFGPWPWYILVLEVLALVSFFIYYLPFAAYDRIWASGALPGALQKLNAPLKNRS